MTTATHRALQVHSSSGRRQGGGAMRMVGREINEIVSPTWKPDTYGPVSTSAATHASLADPRSPRVGRRATNIVITHVAIKSLRGSRARARARYGE